MGTNIDPDLQTKRWRPGGDSAQLGTAEERQNHSSNQGCLMPKLGAVRPKRDAHTSPSLILPRLRVFKYNTVPKP